jgi:hypothetical protein
MSFEIYSIGTSDASPTTVSPPASRRLRHPSKRRVVVDEQDRPLHVRILASSVRPADQGNPQSHSEIRDLIDDPQHPRVYGRRP